MLKRSGAMALSFLYLVTVTGFALNMHFCGNYLASVKIDAPVKKCNVRMVCKMKCCSNKHIEVKVKDSHHASSQLFLFKSFAFNTPALFFSNIFATPTYGTFDLFFSKAPPDLLTAQTATFIKNRNFRI